MTYCTLFSALHEMNETLVGREGAQPLALQTDSDFNELYQTIVRVVVESSSCISTN